MGLHVAANVHTTGQMCTPPVKRARHRSNVHATGTGRTRTQHMRHGRVRSSVQSCVRRAEVSRPQLAAVAVRVCERLGLRGDVGGRSECTQRTEVTLGVGLIGQIFRIDRVNATGRRDACTLPDLMPTNGHIRSV